VSAVSGFSSVELCLPCYVDVLEVRQARGVMGSHPGISNPEVANAGQVDETPGNSPSPISRQGDLFDA